MRISSWKFFHNTERSFNVAEIHQPLEIKMDYQSFLKDGLLYFRLKNFPINVCFLFNRLFHPPLFASQAPIDIATLRSCTLYTHSVSFPTSSNTQTHFKLITSNWYQSNGDEGHTFIFYLPENVPDPLHTDTEIHSFSLKMDQNAIPGRLLVWCYELKIRINIFWNLTSLNHWL